MLANVSDVKYFLFFLSLVRHYCLFKSLHLYTTQQKYLNNPLDSIKSISNKYYTYYGDVTNTTLEGQRLKMYTFEICFLRKCWKKKYLEGK